MIRHILDAIIDEFRAGQCLRDITNHWSCRCTVPGPGMRRAGETLVRRYKENGASDACLTPYPADDKTESLDGHINPLEWQPKAAWLRIASPEDSAGEICNYANEPLSLISGSRPTPLGGVEAELVVPAEPIQADKVEPGQWAGKIILSNQFPSTISAAVHKAGGLGIISDCICPPWLKKYPPVREPEDVPDLVMWTTLPARRSDPP
ncbi:MAG: hypothetical protein KAI66_00230, partial [Lentisphaeria bacterium]|nr:hypothetical protein [Lentisphaeria bacterium]